MFNKDIDKDIEEIKTLEKDIKEFNRCGSELGKKRFLLKMIKSNLEMVKRHEKSDKRDSTILLCMGLFVMIFCLFSFDDTRISIQIISLSATIVTLNNVLRDRISSSSKHSLDLIKLETSVKKLEAEIRELEGSGMQE